MLSPATDSPSTALQDQDRGHSRDLGETKLAQKDLILGPPLTPNRQSVVTSRQTRPAITRTGIPSCLTVTGLIIMAVETQVF